MAKFCQSCGASQSDAAKFCAGCGVQTSTAAPPTKPQLQQPSIRGNSVSVKRMDKRAIIGAIMLALGALGVGFCLAHLEMGHFYIYIRVLTLRHHRTVAKA